MAPPRRPSSAPCARRPPPQRAVVEASISLNSAGCRKLHTNDPLPNSWCAGARDISKINDERCKYDRVDSFQSAAKVCETAVAPGRTCACQPELLQALEQDLFEEFRTGLQTLGDQVKSTFKAELAEQVQALRQDINRASSETKAELRAGGLDPQSIIAAVHESHNSIVSRGLPDTRADTDFQILQEIRMGSVSVLEVLESIRTEGVKSHVDGFVDVDLSAVEGAVADATASLTELISELNIKQNFTTLREGFRDLQTRLAEAPTTADCSAELAPVLDALQRHNHESLTVLREIRTDLSLSSDSLQRHQKDCSAALQEIKGSKGGVDLPSSQEVRQIINEHGTLVVTEIEKLRVMVDTSEVIQTIGNLECEIKKVHEHHAANALGMSELHQMVDRIEQAILDINPGVDVPELVADLQKVKLDVDVSVVLEALNKMQTAMNSVLSRVDLQLDANHDAILDAIRDQSRGDSNGGDHSRAVVGENAAPTLDLSPVLEALTLFSTISLQKQSELQDKVGSIEQVMRNTKPGSLPETCESEGSSAKEVDHTREVEGDRVVQTVDLSPVLEALAQFSATSVQKQSELHEEVCGVEQVIHGIKSELVADLQKVKLDMDVSKILAALTKMQSEVVAGLARVDLTASRACNAVRDLKNCKEKDVDHTSGIAADETAKTLDMSLVLEALAQVTSECRGTAKTVDLLKHESALAVNLEEHFAFLDGNCMQIKEHVVNFEQRLMAKIGSDKLDFTEKKQHKKKERIVGGAVDTSKPDPHPPMVELPTKVGQRVMYLSGGNQEWLIGGVTQLEPLTVFTKGTDELAPDECFAVFADRGHWACPRCSTRCLRPSDCVLNKPCFGCSCSVQSCLPIMPKEAPGIKASLLAAKEKASCASAAMETEVNKALSQLSWDGDELAESEASRVEGMLYEGEDMAESAGPPDKVAPTGAERLKALQALADKFEADEGLNSSEFDEDARSNLSGRGTPPAEGVALQKQVAVAGVVQSGIASRRPVCVPSPLSLSSPADRPSRPNIDLAFRTLAEKMDDDVSLEASSEGDVTAGVGGENLVISARSAGAISLPHSEPNRSFSLAERLTQELGLEDRERQALAGSSTPPQGNSPRQGGHLRQGPQGVSPSLASRQRKLDSPDAPKFGV